MIKASKSAQLHSDTTASTKTTNMSKFVLAFGFLLVLLAVAEANRCPTQCGPKASRSLVCAQDIKGRVCRKMRACQLLDENCRLRHQGRPQLRRTSWWSCRHIKKGASGKCSIGGRKPRAAPRCDLIKCGKKDNKVKCYRSQDNKCRLITKCQAKRDNCRRPRHDKLKSDKMVLCTGMKRGQAPALCKW